MKRAKISVFKARLSSYVAAARRGESVVVTDRQTPVAVLVPYDDEEDGLVIEEPTAPLSELRKIRGIRPRKKVDVVALLRDSRDQR